MSFPIHVIFEDNHLLVVDKPPGLLTQPSGTSEDNLESRCKTWLKKKYAKKGNVFLEAVFRLDKPVSGLVVFAKTSKALSRLHASQREKKYQKIYLALLENCPQPLEGSLEHHLIHDDYKAEVNPHGKFAKLHYRVLSEGERNLVEINLETGRYHQIRAQFSAIHCPVLGDEKYGSQKKYKGEGIALHHFHLEIPHPISGEVLTFEARPPWSR